jgi:hypothetical protein
MSGQHVTEAIWFNAKKALPDSERRVIAVYRHGINSLGKVVFKYHLSEGQFKDLRWKLSDPNYNPAYDVVTQWAEIDPARGGFMPDPFPLESPFPERISNLKQYIA